ncbi:Cytidylyltransferase [Penicillium riverlandense]|uniref:Cytidylyltransferase n=1 Tax=Penicillium riverlandense TaxID=1903569 RepID=UPI00254779DB|nr:Cytidylyltransferase [Penicillium riverlandense]KAJ5812187.1 Cytidylyltransferase [Penicillium riverlandense]
MSPSFHPSKARYATLLKRFIASAKDFDVLATIPSGPPVPPPATLYVLDASFNPPTLAHLHIASTALQETTSARLLLLLATQNADKPSKPASFEDRLAMMELFAHDLRSHLAANPGPATTGLSALAERARLPVIDIGVTKNPYFVDKAATIDASDAYSSPAPLEQPLAPLFARHRLRVTMRPDDDWGGVEEQRGFVDGLARGEREGEGGKREWAQRIQLVEGKAAGEQPVSSTKAREAAQAGRIRDLEWLVPEQTRQFVLDEQPYS